MWIQVRTIDGKETRTVEDLSRLTRIESLRLKIQDIFNVSPQQQRLFYRGKQVKSSFLCSLFTQRTVFDILTGLKKAGGASEWSCAFWNQLPVLVGIRQWFLRKSAGLPSYGKMWMHVRFFFFFLSSCCWGRLACNKCPTTAMCLFTLYQQTKRRTRSVSTCRAKSSASCKREARKTQLCATFNDMHEVPQHVDINYRLHVP